MDGDGSSFEMLAAQHIAAIVARRASGYYDADSADDEGEDGPDNQDSNGAAAAVAYSSDVDDEVRQKALGKNGTV